jgi:hypothetical protein
MAVAKTRRRADKRYDSISLSVEIDGDPKVGTRHWSTDGFIIAEHRGDQVEGQILHPILTVTGRSGRVPVTGRVVKASPHLVVELVDPSPAALTLLAPHPPDKERPELIVATGYRSTDWSLSGFSVTGYRGDLRLGDNLVATLAHDHSSKWVKFACTVVRSHKPSTALAVRFRGLSDGAFEFLEAAVVHAQRK